MDLPEMLPATPVPSPSSNLADRGDNRRVGKPRLACNRCHSQKLRCVKKGQQSACERCSKLKTRCQFSSRASWRSKKCRAQDPGQETTDRSDQQPLPQSALMPSMDAFVAADIGLVLAGSNIETENFEAQAPAYPFLYSSADNSPNLLDSLSWQDSHSEFQPLGQVDNHLAMMVNRDVCNQTSIAGESSSCPSLLPSLQFDVFHESFNHENEPSSHLVRKLASLSLLLHSCAETLPSIANPCQGSPVTDGAAVMNKKDATLFAIDELFHTTTEFINVLKLLGVGIGKSTEPCFFPDLLSDGLDEHRHWYPSPATTERVSENRATFGTHPPLDEATMFMVISCHCRLAEIYESIFRRIQACARSAAPARPLPPRQPPGWGIILPRLQFGSISSPALRVDSVTGPPPTSTSAMYMVLITMLASQLWEQVAITMNQSGEGSSVNGGNTVRYNRDKAQETEYQDDRGEAAMSGARSAISGVWAAVMERTGSLSRTIEATKTMLQRSGL
ncbi:hypothetical protein BX600DRAFT_50955 [Xylariales sp. PMI_506]|nr:hypothetical protein BX600DRAFT_50955 [Xylariales sp. PMI_506]